MKKGNTVYQFLLKALEVMLCSVHGCNLNPWGVHYLKAINNDIITF